MTEPALLVRDLGRLGYAAALSQQRRVNQAVIDGRSPAMLLLVEHDPVITISHRRGAADHLLANETRLRELGIDVQQTDRGGDITYHGPGQLVAYPILPLARFGLNLGRYMRLLEHVVIQTLARFQVHGLRQPGATGVWVDTSPRQPNTPPHTHAPPSKAKICAMGVRVRKNTTMHGLALNVSTDLSHFDTIVPCGLAGSSVTSLDRLLGENSVTMPAVKTALIQTMQTALAQSADEARV